MTDFNDGSLGINFTAAVLGDFPGLSLKSTTPLLITDVKQPVDNGKFTSAISDLMCSQSPDPLNSTRPLCP